MPKSKKPAGGRPAKNFEPRYGATTSYQDRKRRPGESSSGTQGSKSPSHRGHRPAESSDGAPKRRWNAQERAGRDEARGIRTHAGSDRGPRRDDRSDRPNRSYDSKAPRRDDRGDRPARSYDDRPARSYKNDRPARAYDDRAPRRDDRNDRSARSYDNKSPRRDDRSDRPTRSYDSKAPRRDDRSDRPTRSYDSKAPRRDDRGDRPTRSYDNDRPARPAQDRVERDNRRSFGDARPSYRNDDRARQSSSDRPRRDDPRRESNPTRSDWNAKSRSAAQEAHVDVVHERLQGKAIQAALVANVSFGDLGLGENIVQVLTGMGASAPFPIQAATVKPILNGKDVLARGRTGSGKTIAFGAPLVESVLRSQKGQRREFGRSPKALILAPTRELALQIDRTIQPIARSVGLFTTQIYGGVPAGRQVGALKKGVDIIIGTPGRIEDLMNQGKLDLSQIQITVLDEGDHMCELGFLEPVQRILRETAPGSQKLLFSATLDREVAALVDEFLVDPAVYEVAGEDQDSGTIDHRVLVIDHRNKAEILASLVDREGKTLVFTRTRAYAEMLAEQFDDAGIRALALHGDLNQAKRTRNLERMTSGRVHVLVATDVAARGIHVDDIDLVVQADAPDEYKTYLHRSGRTGRAGRSGTVVTLIPRQRRNRMSDLLDRAEIDAPFDEVRPGDALIEELANRQLSNVDA
ncbi:DEAD/DEAH box helicase [Microbacterium marmarense]|uniref:DEAD/DEAH box helicase n=1 Tax=Microbacterium marmarense TaxID=3122051 RepID=A0ABU8LS71_9MICO